MSVRVFIFVVALVVFVAAVLWNTDDVQRDESSVTR